MIACYYICLSLYMELLHIEQGTFLLRTQAHISKHSLLFQKHVVIRYESFRMPYADASFSCPVDGCFALQASCRLTRMYLTTSCLAE